MIWWLIVEWPTTNLKTTFQWWFEVIWNQSWQTQTLKYNIRYQYPQQHVFFPSHVIKVILCTSSNTLVTLFLHSEFSRLMKFTNDLINIRSDLYYNRLLCSVSAICKWAGGLFWNQSILWLADATLSGYWQCKLRPADSQLSRTRRTIQHLVLSGDTNTLEGFQFK